MSGTYWRRSLTELIPTGLKNHKQIARATRMITHQRPIAQQIGHACGLQFLEICSEYHMRRSLGKVNNRLSYLLLTEALLSDIGLIKIDAVTVDRGNHL